jgi:hypothetical protein
MKSSSRRCAGFQNLPNFGDKIVVGHLVTLVRSPSVSLRQRATVIQMSSVRRAARRRSDSMGRISQQSIRRHLMAFLCAGQQISSRGLECRTNRSPEEDAGSRFTTSIMAFTRQTCRHQMCHRPGFYFLGHNAIFPSTTFPAQYAAFPTVVRKETRIGDGRIAKMR